MADNLRQHEVLQMLQQRIDRYKPILERQFDVALGDVVAAPLRSTEWLAYIYAESDRELHAAAMSQHGRPPTTIRRGLHQLEKLLLWLPALAFLAIRQWYPDYFLKWRDDTRQVLVSFAGWSGTDYQEIVPKLDQLAVHEMAHGVWDRLAGDQKETHSRRWRLWNEGFAHYIADIHMAEFYPATAVVATDFSEFRRQGLRMVSELVGRYDWTILRSVPTRWPEFDDRAVQLSDSQ
jgi:hypothetical protein